MRSVLDDREAVRRLDRSGLLGAAEGLPESMSGQLAEASELLGRFPRSGFRNVVFMGMGGSASVGDFVLNWLGDRIWVPVVVNRDPVLPGFVGRDSLCVAVSFSGDTRETLSAFRAARRRGSGLVTIGTGGRLLRLAEKWGVPFVRVRSAPAARAALGQMIVASALVLYKCGVVPDPRPEIVGAVRELGRLRRRVRSDVPLVDNSAKRLAVILKGGLPVVFAFGRMGSVARRFKNQLAENCKVFAKCSLLPEAGHNEIEAWHDQRIRLCPVFVRDFSETEVERVMLGSFWSTLTRASGVRPALVRLRAGSHLGELLLPVFYLDLVSLYLAFLKGVDPGDTPWLRRYRQGI